MLEFNAAVVSYVTITMGGIVAMVLIHDVMETIKWSRLVRLEEGAEKARREHARKIFADNTISFPEVSAPLALNEIKFDQGTRTL